MKEDKIQSNLCCMKRCVCIAIVLFLWQAGSKAEEISFFEEFRLNTQTNAAEVHWRAEAGYDYEIFRTDSLTENSLVLAGSGLEGVLPLSVWQSAPLSAGRGFYLIRRYEPDLPPVEPTEVLSNTKFVSSVAPWFLVLNAGSSASGFISANNQLEVDITDPGSAQFHIQLIHNNLSLTTGTNYTLNFRVRSVGSSRSILALVQTSNPGRVDLLRQTVNISNTAQDFSLPFAMNASNGQGARVVFNLGNNATDVIFECVSLSSPGGPQLSFRAAAHQFNSRLGGGNNFAAFMASGGFGAEEDYDLLRENGFQHCRIGYRLDEEVGPAPDFIVPQSHLDELRRLVDYCLGEGLIAILDPVHNWANGPGFTYPSDLPKLEAIWQQVAGEFQNYPSRSLAFEILNEPHAGANIQTVTSAALAVIRGFSGNQNRPVIISGEGFSTRQALINLFNNDQIPTNDPWLIGTFHYYDPRGFTTPDSSAGNGSAIPWADGGAGDPEFDQVAIDFAAVDSANRAWADRNNTERLPIFLGEFGVDNIAALADRKRWLAWIRMQAEAFNFSWSHWLMYNDIDFAKGMGPWTSLERTNPSLRTFQADPVEALVGNYQAETAIFLGAAVASSASYNFQGTGSALLPGSNDALEFAVFVPREDEYEITIRYKSDSPVTLSAQSFNTGGSLLDSETFMLAATPLANSWSVRALSLEMASDGSSRIVLTNQSNQSLEIDYLDVEKPVN
ncbi:MAG: cellulase family glycosylhydrolase [Verrucomicrobiota bacterium]